ncbi:cardiolipin synthase [Taibaiella koreensis]|uniref:cardiolipin synthase n=1 Tax=Taibaiella koreensis TaxID=1268548 RepID=UPI000E5A0A89|nr:cardiolipin synthase [Taibaiella koreensis]
MWEQVLKHYPTVSLVFVVLLSVFTIVRIIMDTGNSAKTMAYILLVFLFPVGGAAIYFIFGVNYRRRKLFTKKIIANEALFLKIQDRLEAASLKILEERPPDIAGSEDLIRLLLKDSRAPLSYNKVKLLINGEQKFEAVFAAIEKATHFIHLEYYIFDDDDIGNRLLRLLARKAGEGVTIRLIYDDFGSHGINNDAIAALREAGGLAFPFYEVKFYLLANRLNYRDHRKIIIVDGLLGFTGGINVSDKYINDGNPEKLYWRDTHVMLEGPAVNNLQYHFIANWNFCAEETLEVDRQFFPIPFEHEEGRDDLVQIVAGGPDYPSSAIMLSFFTAIVSARESVYITSPYFIPNESIYDALKKAALSGKDVRLLLPGVSDSRIVNAAARSYFADLMTCGVRIFLYQKGFVHAKTIAIDDNLAMVGSANMDGRSFELNFEINAVIYSRTICKQLVDNFHTDTGFSVELSPVQWAQRPWWRELIDDIARLLSPIL